ncbi:MAG TPA: hypothetical protein VF783_18350 [Terriglobales bacterium]
MTHSSPPAMTPATIRETIMFAFTRSAGFAEIELTDETAFMIMSMLDDLWLWFNTVYGDQARRHHPPEDGETSGNPPDLFDDPLDPF